MIDKELLHQAAEDIDIFQADLTEEYERLCKPQPRKLRLWPLAVAACVAGIVAISPIAIPYPDIEPHPERYRLLFGHPATHDDLADIDPARLLSPASPPVFISHSPLDDVVPIESPRLFMEKARSMGCQTMFYEYEGIGTGHRIWRLGITPHRLLPELEEAILKFLKTLPPDKG